MVNIEAGMQPQADSLQPGAGESILVISATGAETMEIQAGGGDTLLQTEARTVVVQRKMEEHDAWGIGVTLVSMFVVITSLAVLNVLFDWVGRISVARAKRGVKPTQSGLAAEAHRGVGGDGVVAAISMALHAYREEARDQESLYSTIQEMERRYSPWNSRIYGVMQSREWARMRHGK